MELRGPPAGNRAAFGNDQGCRAPDLPQSESQPHRAVATLSSDGKGKTGKLRPGGAGLCRQSAESGPEPGLPATRQGANPMTCHPRGASLSLPKGE